jgi:hypothetical protein
MQNDWRSKDFWPGGRVRLATSAEATISDDTNPPWRIPNNYERHQVLEICRRRTDQRSFKTPLKQRSLLRWPWRRWGRLCLNRCRGRRIVVADARLVHPLVDDPLAQLWRRLHQHLLPGRPVESGIEVGRMQHRRHAVMEACRICSQQLYLAFMRC